MCVTDPVFLPNALSFCEAWFVKWLEEGDERKWKVKHIVSSSRARSDTFYL